jgi:hypothetical protein
MNTFFTYVKTHKSKIALIIFLLCVFIFFFVFFAKVHALVLFDSDDWYNASYYRSATPEWKGANPIKILPEKLFPIATSLATSLIYPFNNNFIQATTIMYAIIVSFFITLYVYYFMKFLKARFDLPVYSNILIAIIFLICHFLIFRNKPYDSNDYMFLAMNVTCYFHYLIPALLNCTLVMYMMSKEKLELKGSVKSRYISFGSIFSNFFKSI